MSRRNTIADLIAAPVTYRDEQGELHSEEPMDAHTEKSKRRVKSKSEEKEELPPSDHEKRFEELLEMIADVRKDQQALINAQKEKAEKEEQAREERERLRQERKAQKKDETAKYWEKQMEKIQELITSQTKKTRRETETEMRKQYDEEIRRMGPVYLQF